MARNTLSVNYPIDKDCHYSDGKLKEAFLFELLAFQPLDSDISYYVQFKLTLVLRYKSFFIKNGIGGVCLMLCVCVTEHGYNECLVMLENSNND